MAPLKWWQTAVFYQIYPRSFADGNADGIGDFKGMTQKLDYLADLGVNALWLSPHFPSPNWDWGYDISDYMNVAPDYGTLDDFKTFLAEAHKRGLHVILDLVLNHTSDQHPWFLESRTGANNQKSDWYVWRDPLPSSDGSRIPPNNWQSSFDGDAWTFVPERGQFYYHYFMKQQPDLNWHNPAVRQAMWTAVRFWLDLGVDGFRLDAIGTIFEDPALTPHTVPMGLAQLRRASQLAQTPSEKRKVERYWREMFQHQLDQPGIHELMKELRAILKEYDGDRMLVGEDENISYLGDGDDELQLVFNFPLMNTDRLTPANIRRNQKLRLLQLEALPVKGWACNTLGNHDAPRVFNRFGDGVHDAALARLSLALMLTLKGTPFLYNGEEIGMTDTPDIDPSRLRDTMATWYYTALLEDLKVDPTEAARRAAEMTRDKNRTPLQWSNAANGGFCPPNATPWLPVNPNFAQGVNVEDELADPCSLLNYYRQMLRLRRSNPALVSGKYKPLHHTAVNYFAFLRKSSEQTVLVILNYSETPIDPDFARVAEIKGRTLRRLFPDGQPEGRLIGSFDVYLAEVQ